MGDQQQVSTRWIITGVAAVAAAFVAVLAMLLGAGSGSNTGSGPIGTVTTTIPSPKPAPEDSYIDFLDGSGHFPSNVTGDARDVWLRAGRTACNLLELNGNLVGTRFEITRSLADHSRQGMAEPGLAKRAVAVVEAASRYLCPEVSAS